MAAIPVYVISLARAAARRAEMVAHLQALGIAFELVEGVDGQAMPAQTRQALQPPGTDYPPGVIGCYLSHMRAYRRLLEGAAPVALILEDDARLSPVVLPMIAGGVRSRDFDYCLLDYVHETDVGPVYYDADDAVEIAPGLRAFATHAGPAGLHAYLITREAAAHRLDHEAPIRHAVDVYSVLPYRPRFRVTIRPRCAGVSESSMRSFINDERDQLGQLSLRRLRRMPGFYALRDLLWLDRYRLRPGIYALQRAGVLPGRGRWRPLPPGRPVLV